jgi:hypothetical protein
MRGKIFFDDLAELAEFLREFHGATALFVVNKAGSRWVLEFTGGY